MGKGLDTGKSFLQGVLSKITDPEHKAAAEKLLSDAVFVTEVGNGVEGQAEIDRQLQALTTQKTALDTLKGNLDTREAGLESWHGELTTWHERNRDALLEAKRIKEGKPAGDGKVVPPAEGVLTDEKFSEQMKGERAAFLGFSRDQNQITRDYFTKFHEILDLEPLLRHPQIANVGLTGVYELVHKERLDKFKTDSALEAENKIRADERKKVLEGQAQMPYPSPTGVGTGSPLDALAPSQKEPVVDAAVAHYNRLQAEHAGAATK